MRDKRFDCGAVLTVIKMYRYMVYVEIFVTVNYGAGQSDPNTRTVKHADSNNC